MSQVYSYLKKGGRLNIEDCPVCSPPWPNTWVEWRLGMAGLKAGACQAVTFPKGGPFWRQAIPEIAGGLNEGRTIDEIEHLVSIHPWELLDNGNCRPVEQFILVAIDKSGVVIGKGADVPEGNGVTEIFPQLMVLFTFCLANCKNVIAEEQREYMRPRGGGGGSMRRFYRYHILKIMGSFAGAKHESSDNPGNRPMHICRGHFAKYTDEAPLFGKYTGLFWRPMHIRGNVANGVVDKDYEMAVSNG